MLPSKAPIAPRILLLFTDIRSPGFSKLFRNKSIVGLTAVLEHYLKEILKNHFCQNVDRGIFNSFKETFKDKIKRDITDFDKYTRLWSYYQLRHIIVHNLGRIDQKFKKETGADHEEGSPNVYYPHEVSEYKELIKDFVNFVDSYLD